MNLDPPSYTCPTHGGDLTPQVTEAVEEESGPLIYTGLRPRRRQPQRFEVIVSCLGGGVVRSGAGGEAHELAFAGSYSP